MGFLAEPIEAPGSAPPPVEFLSRVDSAQGGHTPPKIHLIARSSDFKNHKSLERMIRSLRWGRFPAGAATPEHPT
jgi:hypothetical protein